MVDPAATSTSDVPLPSSSSSSSSSWSLVRALHSFSPAAEAAAGAAGAGGGGSCLSFEAGQLIKCYNKDQSGWWDGRLVLDLGAEDDERLGDRGWFPSNYVEELEGNHHPHRSSSPSHTTTRSSASSSSSSASRPLPPPTTTTTTEVEGEWPALLAALQHPISLLHSAVQQSRKSHYQPSTACIISSIRTLLSTTNCLTRESPILRQHPLLASHRKRILSALAALVNQARRASRDSREQEEQQKEEGEEMLRCAEKVKREVEGFLKEARGCGVELLGASPTTTTTNSSSADDLSSTAAIDARKSSLDVLTSPLPLPPPSPTSTPVTLRTPTALHSLLLTKHDALLSLVASFIGHVHQHQPHADVTTDEWAIAQLIELTREVVKGVREVLVVVEGVVGMPPRRRVGEEGRGGAEELEQARERLYAAVTGLVAVARRVTSSDEDEDDEDDDDGGGEGDDGAGKKAPLLLTAARAVLRAGGECVAGVKALVPLDLEGGEMEELRLDFGRVNLGSGVASVEEEEEEERGSKRTHTISMLGRKDSSLKGLREMYEATTTTATGREEEGTATVGIEEGEMERRGSEATVRASTRGRPSRSGSRNPSLIPAAEAVPLPFLPPTTTAAIAAPPPRKSTDSDSEPMSRGTSTSNASSFRSTLSTATTNTNTSNDTSPRSSLNTTRTSLSSGVVVKTSAIPAMPSLLPHHHHHHPPPPPSPSKSTTSAPTTTTPAHLSRDYQPQEISFNADGHVTGGTLRCLVERMTLHDTTIDPTFSSTFFLTFRMFTTPLELCEVLWRRFEIAPPEELGEEERKVWERVKRTPVRLRIYNLFKTWLESYWQQETDGVVVERLLEWCRTRLSDAMASAAGRLVDLIQKRVIAAQQAAQAASSNLSLHSTISSTSSSSTSLPLPPQVTQHHRGLTRMQSTDKFRAGKILPATQLYSSTHSPSPPFLAPSSSSTSSSTGGFNHSPPPPAPILPRHLIPLLRSPSSSFSITEIDPLELARQLTIMESRVYCAIRAEELLGQEFSKRGGVKAENVRAMSTLSTRLTGWITEVVLLEQDAKKRTGLLKYFIKLGDRCFHLNNYNTLFAVLAALNSSTITRLKKTWDGLAPKYRQSLDQLRKATEHTRNYAEYRAKIRSAVPPCLPFVGLFLTDITMCSEGNPPERPSPGDPSLRLINFDRYQKMARIVGDLQRFQVAYNLLEVPEIQTYLAQALEGLAHGGDASSLYRQSLLVEPRTQQQNGQPASSASSFASSHHRGDFFNWKS